MDAKPIRRVVLVPREAGDGVPAAGQPHRVRRFRLARVAVTPRSALGQDRHERMEDVVRRERDGYADA
jgi:hypothetical protein